MKYSHFMYRTSTRIILALLIASPATIFAETRQETNTWAYHKGWDKSSNLNYSLARSPLPKRGFFDNLRLEFSCKENKLQFTLDANSLITSRGRSFAFDYQVDKKDLVAIPMKTFKDTKRRGYTDEHVERIAEDMMSGQSIFIRVHTLVTTILSSVIPMGDASQPIQQVLADCGVELPGTKAVQPTYTLADFERDLKTMLPEQQGEVLGKIKIIMEEFR